MLGIDMRKVPGCGVAAFAARDFAPGEVVLEESAVLVSAVACNPSNRELWQALVREERSRRLPAFQPAGHLGALCALRDLGLATCRAKLLTKCVGPEEALPSPQDAKREAQVLRAAIREGLVPHSSSAFSPDEYARLRRVIQLNGFRFNANVREGQTGYDIGEVLFDNVSRINHSCEPNLAFNLSWNEVSNTVHIRVEPLTHLREGDEVNISYMPEETRQKLPPLERRRQLQQHWLFTCGCVRCLTECGDAAAEERAAAEKHELLAAVGDDWAGVKAGAAAVPQRGALGARDNSPGRCSSGSSSKGLCWDDLGDPDELKDSPP